MPKKQGEDLFTQNLCDYLRHALRKQLGEHGLEIVSHVKILSDANCYAAEARGSGGRQAQIALNCLEQDIVIGQYGSTSVAVRDLLKNIGDKSQILMPRVIMEVKYGGISSHGLMTYSDIATRMKSMYQGLRYYLVMRFGNKSREVLERHGRGYDRIYEFEHNKPGRVSYSPTSYHPGDWDSHMLSKAFQEGLDRMLVDIVADLSTSRVWRF